MKKMRKELKVAAKNTTWRHIWPRAVYLDGPDTLEYSIFLESLVCAHYVRNLVIEILCEDYDPMLLNHSPEYYIDEYSTDYPELCLILFHLGLFGPLSTLGVASDFVRRGGVYRIFGISNDSPLHDVDFYSKNIPIIRITDYVFTLGTNQPQFSTIDDVQNYYRDPDRIEEISNLCEFWIRKFYFAQQQK